MKPYILRTFSAFLLVFGVFFQADAEFLEKMDDNTLWIENGKNISFSSTRGTANAWSGELNFAPLTDGEGFSVESVSPQQYMSYRYVPISEEYPWFVFEITGIEQKPGYASWGFALNNRRVGQVSNPRKGYYVFNVFDRAEAARKKGAAALRLDIYGLKLDLKYFKMVKTPDYCVEVTSSAFSTKKSFAFGDDLKFTVRLKEPAEDVSLRFYHSYGMRELTLNGQDKLQLKPENKDFKVWSAILKLESIGGFDDKKLNVAAGITVKATILGGALIEPIWGTINYPFDSCKGK